MGVEAKSDGAECCPVGQARRHGMMWHILLLLLESEEIRVISAD